MFDSVPFLSVEEVDKAILKISNDCSPGHDSICIQHFKWTHSSIVVILQIILNIFLSIGEVPSAFGLGIVTPIPKFKGNKTTVTPEDFRSITINVIASKIFEHSILRYFENLTSSERQFGFKKGASCSHAIHLVRNSINYFIKGGNTINLGFVDVRKAFDRANFWGILNLLLRKNINPYIISVIEHWFKIGSAQIRWNNILSEPVLLAAGVRQGGVLSPLLFSAFLDPLLDALEKARMGCFIRGMCLIAFFMPMTCY